MVTKKSYEEFVRTGAGHERPAFFFVYFSVISVCSVAGLLRFLAARHVFSATEGTEHEQEYGAAVEVILPPGNLRVLCVLGG